MEQKFNVDVINCPSRLVLNLISNKWVILIILKLAEKPYRFGELKRKVAGISPKVLSNLLKQLEQYKLVNRHSIETPVLNVVYSLSEIGKSLSVVCQYITEWSENNVSHML